MKTGITPEQGDILLIPVPFTDLSSQKQRPVVVISNNAYNRKTDDVIVVALTSNPAPVEYGFVLDSSNLDLGTLNRPGKVRVDKIYALSQSIVIKRFGRVKQEIIEHIRDLLQQMTARHNS
jgi:mRNA interferase MazF